NRVALAETQTTRSGPEDRHPEIHDIAEAERNIHQMQSNSWARDNNVPACRSSPHHGSRTGGPRDNGFKRG
ncbi:hypothetical protein EJ07DRAFT_31782, partial [Lizonia empirigonia]